MNQHIANTNWLPYVLILVMGFILYILYGEYKEIHEENEKSKAELVTAYQIMGTIQNYNEKRFRELEKVKTRSWKKGKHEAKF